MNALFKTAIVAFSLFASAAAATQGDEITAIGYGKTMQHAKIITINTWKSAAKDSYGYADWNGARTGPLECFKNEYSDTSVQSTSDFREVIREGGNDQDPWVCSVSGTQQVTY